MRRGGTIERRRSAPLGANATIAPGYEVIEHLRRGNDLDVYDTWSVERLSRCVVKALRPDRGHKKRVRAALLREGALLGQLAHPHIVRAYETIAEPLPMVVLETLPGSTLSVLIAEEPVRPPEELGHLGLQLASALHYLHSRDILHLDLKPSNLIAEAGRVKLIDLSLARAPGPAGPGIGTWQYLSPEQARGEHLGPPADVWGLGAVLFEVATGEAPFDDDPDAWTDPPSNPSGTYSEAAPERYPQLERRARRPESVRALPAQLGGLIVACLDPEPADRPSIAELAGAFERLAGLPAAERRWSAHSAVVA